MIYHCGVVFCFYNITALYNILFDLGLNVAVKFHNLVIVTSLILWIVTSQLSAGVDCDPEQGLLTGYCQPEPAEPRSHVGRISTP